jgi:hypothetical protein
MPAGVPVWRGVAAQGHATTLASTQMNPGIAGLHTLLTFGMPGEFQFVNALDVLAKIAAHAHTS